MKRILLLTVAIAGGGALAWMFAQVAVSPRPLAGVFPPGPVLYLEAANCQSLWKDWNGSQEKRLWLTSDNYEVFSRSNLFLKLQNAQNEFSAAAGVPPNMALMDTIAGAESALAIYDIGQLQFLYITRMPSAKFAESALWKTRGSYQPRKSGGLDYYVRVDRASKRVAAFASAKDYLLLGTQEDALAGALALLSGASASNVTQEPWFARSVQAAKQHGELRLVLNMEKLLQSPYMRSYWFQHNATELKQYDAAISDARRNQNRIDETRILFRTEGQPATWNEAAVAQLTRLAPSNAGLFRAWASPTTAEAYDLLRRKIFEPRTDAARNDKKAPAAASMDATVGTEADLEVRIDEPPLDIGPAQDTLVPHLLDEIKLDGMMQVERTRVLPDGTFVGIDSAVVLLAAADWGKIENSANGGLSPIQVTARGKILVASNRPELAAEILILATRPPQQPARYAARYGHAAELPNLIRMMRLIDAPLKTEGPSFFSGNLSSLGSTLGRLDATSIAVHDTGAVVSQSVTYTWKQ